ncbi:MAG: hypothetical protein V1794_03635, partial [Candidatus Glassbacteria bacterium]
LLSGLPCLFMVVMTTWAMLLNEGNFIRGGQPLLAVINGFLIFLSSWMVIEAAGKIFRPVPGEPSPAGA